MIFGKAAFRIVCGALIVLSTWLLAYSGWRGRILNPDLVPPANAAIEFTQDGKLPEKSCLSSTCGYDPPGTSWLLLPGIVLFGDARLFEAPGTLILHALTIAGLIFIGQILGAVEAGMLAAAFYSIGPRGLFFASSLWPRSHPAFCVWTLVFLLLYLKSRRSLYFGLAILTFGMGLLVFLEMAPLGIAFPLALVSDARGRRLAAYAAGAVVLVIGIWIPYLRFEGTRNYDDLKRLLARGRCPIVEVSSYNWCSAGRTPVYVTVTNKPFEIPITSAEIAEPKWKLRQSVGRLLGNVSPSFAMNWRGTEAGAGIPFLTALRSAIFVLGLVTVAKRCASKRTAFWSWWTSPRLLLLGGMIGLLIGATLHPRFIGLFTRSGTYYDLMNTYSREALWLGLFLLVIGGLLIVRGWKDVPDLLPANPSGYRLIMGTYLVSWMFWAVIGGDYRYFFWLWPMQALIMGLGIGLCFSIFGEPRENSWGRWLLPAALVALIAAHGGVAARVSGWARESWSGKDDPIIASLDQIANERKSEPGRSVRIVYEIPVREYIPIAGALDQMYLPGMEYNLYLRRKYGLQNEVQCVGLPSPPAYYLIRDEDRRLKSGIGEFVWFDVDSEATKNMKVMNRRGSITLLAEVGPMKTAGID